MRQTHPLSSEVAIVNQTPCRCLRPYPVLPWSWTPGPCPSYPPGHSAFPVMRLPSLPDSCPTGIRRPSAADLTHRSDLLNPSKDPCPMAVSVSIPTPWSSAYGPMAAEDPTGSPDRHYVEPSRVNWACPSPFQPSYRKIQKVMDAKWRGEGAWLDVKHLARESVRPCGMI